LNRAEIRNIASSTSAIYGNGSACIEMGNTTSQEHNIRIDDCYLHDSIRTVDDTGHGIEWYSAGNGSTSSVIIENNTIGPNIGTKGIEAYGTNNIIRNNFITGSGDHGIVITADYCDVYNNVVKMVPPYVHEPVFGIKVNYSHNDFWNNLIYQPQQSSGSINNNMQGWGTLDNASNNRFVANTVINGWDFNGNRQGAGASLADEGAPGSNNTIQNCIFAYSSCNPNSSWYGVQLYLSTASTSCSVSSSALWSTNSSDPVIAVNNGGSYSFYTAASASGSTFGTGNTFANLTQANPAFTGGSLPSGIDSSFHPNTTYFALSANTPAAIRNTGKSLTSLPANGAQPSSKFATDILGNTRSAWSMGAYEYGAAVAPSAPTGLHVIASQ
jgi:hypothetical protein